MLGAMNRRLRAPHLLFAATALTCLATPSLSQAADFYVDPAAGSMAGDGSQAQPWSTLEEVVAANLIASENWSSLPYASGATLAPKNPGAPVKAGDTIWLATGYHGRLDLTGYYNSSNITIAAAPGESPRFASVLIRAGKNWVIRGLQISQDYAPSYQRGTMFTLDSHNYNGPVSDVVVEGCSLASVADASGWSAGDWDSLASNGFDVDGSNMTIRGNQLKNVNFGISVSATNSLIERNTVDSFSGDGLRGLGDHTTFQYNVVKNCYDVNDNHDDGFQSWSVGPGGVGTGEVTGIVLRGNVIINYEDPNQPLRGPLQGIGCFDGTFVDWVVENNVIITDHWHGISLYGVRNVRVVNNTVLDPNAESPGPPWIKLTEHKDGTPPENCIVRNNLATAFTSSTSGVTEDHNIVLDDLTKYFVNPPYDVHLLDNAPAIDQGVSDLAPQADIEGIPRPQGSAVDVGAYEWHDPSVMPPDAGFGGSGMGGSNMGGMGGSSGGGDGGSQSSGGSQSGGASAGTANSGGAAGTTSASAAGDDSGCGCRTSRRTPPTQALLLGLGLGLATLRRRQTRTR